MLLAALHLDLLIWLECPWDGDSKQWLTAEFPNVFLQRTITASNSKGGTRTSVKNIKGAVLIICPGLGKYS